MPYRTPDASAYTAMKRINDARTANVSLDPTKYRSVVPFYNLYRPSYLVNVGANALLSNKFVQPQFFPQGSFIGDPFIADFDGATVSVNAPLYTFGDSLDYDVQSGTVYLKLVNIPTGSDNPGGTALTKIKNIVIEFESAPNIQTGTFSGPVVPSAEGVYLVNSWQYVLGTGAAINAFEGVIFTFKMASTVPNITAIYVDLIE